MSKSSKKWVAVAVLGAAGIGAWQLGQRLWGSDSVDADSARHAVNQVWIERLPTDQRDMISHFLLIKHPQGRIGGVGKSSQWRHFVELFQWGLEGERLSVYLPQEQQKAQLRVRTWECDGEAPDPFELCLELSSGKRSVTMYSRKDWVIEPKDVAGSLADIAEDNPELASTLAAIEPEAAPAELAADAESWRTVELLDR
ncbi:MAG: hypothetical protein K1X88_17935 [Nannocystaceae bacterium]|nr:hypothetical protein [Nannocystaceae bacterium]